MRPLRQGGNIVTLKAVFIGGAAKGQQVRCGGLCETIKAGGSIVTLKAVFSGGAAKGQQVRRGELYETIKAGQK